MFVLHDFVMKTLHGMVGKEPDYKVRQYALSWYDKAELTAEDMDAIEMAIEAQNTVPDILPAVENEPAEETTEETMGGTVNV